MRVTKDSLRGCLWYRKRVRRGRSGGYAHHIVNAAAAAQRIAYEAGELGQEELDSAQCAELIAETISGRNDLYNLRITTGVDDRMLRTAEILAKATETWGPQLPAERTEQVLATIAQESGGDGQTLAGSGPPASRQPPVPYAVWCRCRERGGQCQPKFV